MAKTAKGPLKEMWPRQSFTYGQGKIEVERQTVRHSIAAARIISALPDAADPAERVYQMIFSRIVTQTVSIEGLEISFPQLGASDEEWRKAYEQFLNMDGQLVERWYSALSDVDRPFNEQEFWPVYQLPEEEQKNLESAD